MQELSGATRRRIMLFTAIVVACLCVASSNNAFPALACDTGSLGLMTGASTTTLDGETTNGVHVQWRSAFSVV
jgi:hypothetical protein